MFDQQPLVVLQGQLVKLVFTQSSANTLQVGDIIRELLDRLHLLFKEFPLKEVHHLSKREQIHVVSLGHERYSFLGVHVHENACQCCAIWYIHHLKLFLLNGKMEQNEEMRRLHQNGYQFSYAPLPFLSIIVQTAHKCVC